MTKDKTPASTEPPRPTWSELIDAYLEHVQTKSAETAWSICPIVGMTFCSPPETQWGVVLELIERAPDDDDVLGDLAAGPLEGLLGQHGECVIGWVEEQFKKDPKFAKVLTGVWQYMMSEEVWQRVQNLQAVAPVRLHAKKEAGG